MNEKGKSTSVCNICLKQEPLELFDRLYLCNNCLSKVKKLLELKNSSNISKEQNAGGLKEEL